MTGTKPLAANLLMALSLMLAVFVAPATAQTEAPPQDIPDFNQIRLTEQHLTSFIAAQGDLAAISKRIEAVGDKEDPQLDADLETLAKKYGFASFEQLEDVASNIMFVFDVTDPKTGEFRDPKEDIKAEMAEVDADKTISGEEKKKRKAQLEEDLQSLPSLKFKENLAQVHKYRAELEKAMQ